MFHTVFPLVLTLSLCLLVAVSTHLVMSLGQTLIHYKIAHHPIGGRIFRGHINFHHTHYSDDHLVSQTYLGDEGNTTPYFFIPILLAADPCGYFLLPVDLFVVAVVACAFVVLRARPISTRNTTQRDRGSDGLHGSGADSSCTSSITATPTVILR